MKLPVIMLCILSTAGFVSTAQQVKKGFATVPLATADSLFAATDWKGAATAYESILKQGPVNPAVSSGLGFCYHNLTQYNKAVQTYLTVLQNNKDQELSKTTLIRLARSYALLKENDHAFSSINKALDLGYRKAGELEKESDFEELRSDARFTPIVNKARENAFPCTKKEQLREFDFWIGDWTAFVTGTSKVAGYSRIESASGGCMILENWTSAGIVPFNGKSINFIDAKTGKWKQIWVGSDAPDVTEFLNGSYHDGAMRFEFEEITPEGTKQSVRFIFYNEGPDQVRQHHQVSTDDGKTWNTSYDFTYKRNTE